MSQNMIILKRMHDKMTYTYKKYHNKTLIFWHYW